MCACRLRRRHESRGLDRADANLALEYWILAKKERERSADAVTLTHTGTEEDAALAYLTTPNNTRTPILCIPVSSAYTYKDVLT
jgi:hypothetical protein